MKPGLRAIVATMKLVLRCYRLQQSELRVWYNAERDPRDGLWRQLPDNGCLHGLHRQGQGPLPGPIMWQLNLLLEYGGELEDI